jgi:uncharacterized membrane protein
MLHTARKGRRRADVSHTKALDFEDENPRRRTMQTLHTSYNDGAAARRPHAPEEGGVAPRPAGRTAPRGAGRRASGLGWFSIGLGLAEIVAPRALARAVGLRTNGRTQTAMLALGLREIASGVGILAGRQSQGWVWARVAGDLIDLTLLGTAVPSSASGRGRALGAMAAVAGVTVLDTVTALQLGHGPRVKAAPGVRIAKAITVGCTPTEAYDVFRDVQKLPRFMTHVESVAWVEGGHLRWRLRGPAGTHLEWETEMTADLPGERVAWRSVEGANVLSEGSVRFAPAPGGRGTEVLLELRYEPPGGELGAAIGRLLEALPAHVIEGDLHRFKQLVELGEITQSDASIHRRPHPARPVAAGEKVSES